MCAAGGEVRVEVTGEEMGLTGVAADGAFVAGEFLPGREAVIAQNFSVVVGNFRGRGGAV